MAESFLVRVDMLRLLRTIEKTIRGLFFHHRGYPVPEDCRVWCHCLNRMNETGLKIYREQIVPLTVNTPVVEVGDRTFRYRWGIVEDFSENMFFQFGFYEITDFIGFTMSSAKDATGFQIT